MVISSQRSPDLLFMRSELTINQAQLADFGTYQCTIKNSIDTDSLLISLKLTAPTGKPLLEQEIPLIHLIEERGDLHCSRLITLISRFHLSLV